MAVFIIQVYSVNSEMITKFIDASAAATRALLKIFFIHRKVATPRAFR